MTDYFYLFIANVLVLFSVVNPIGNAFVINNNYLMALTDDQKKVVIRKVAFCGFWVCLVGFLVGKFLLALFGLSIPVIQIAGGAIICRNGWRFFMDDGDSPEEEDTVSEDIPHTSNKKMQYSYLLANIFYPLTFPTMIGAGTFSVLLTLAANATSTTVPQTLLNFLIVIIAIALICVLIYFIFVNTAMVQKKLGREGNIVVKKMTSFFTICIGLKITLTGFTEIAVVIFERIKPLL